MDDRLLTLGEGMKTDLEVNLDEEPETELIHYRGEYLADSGMPRALGSSPLPICDAAAKVSGRVY